MLRLSLYRSSLSFDFTTNVLVDELSSRKIYWLWKWTHYISISPIRLSIRCASWEVIDNLMGHLRNCDFIRLMLSLLYLKVYWFYRFFRSVFDVRWRNTPPRRIPEPKIDSWNASWSGPLRFLPYFLPSPSPSLPEPNPSRSPYFPPPLFNDWSNKLLFWSLPLVLTASLCALLARLWQIYLFLYSVV